MPWAQADPMSERVRFVRALRMRKASFRSLCAAFGVAPKTGYKWLHLFEAGGAEALRDRSRRPKTNSRAMSPELAERFVALRQEHPTWGPKKLVAWMKAHEEGLGVAAASTVGELLKRRGLVELRKRFRHQPPRTEPLRHADKPNAVWAMDFKGWFLLGDGTRCDPLTITDAFSRYLLCCKAGTFSGSPVGEDVWAALVQAFREYGMPDTIRTDNGQPWASPKGTLGITKLGVTIMKAGIRLEHIQPGKPHQNGRHERFHLTLQQETVRPPATAMPAQQHRFDAFRREYNEHRPHEALGQRPPSSVYARSKRTFSGRLREPEYPRNYEIVVPGRHGYANFRGQLHFFSSALRDERVGIIEVEEGCFAVHFCQRLLGHIHIAHPELGLIAA